ncbi:hypothetical protein ACFV1S_19715 [Streptomyces globisporus]|uniref:hypothetical protein n=1 Tax=Streptomyces TaxID=1883 RepID=UPI00093FAB3A
MRSGPRRRRPAQGAGRHRCLGTFGRPHRPALPGLAEFTGQVLHAAEYRSPVPFTGGRPAVVGAGNSAVQIAAEPAGTARVMLATRGPVQCAAQRILGRDLHFWTARTGLDTTPLGRLLRRPPRQPVLDDGRYRTALDADGSPRHREGLATGVPGLAFVGLEWQRNLSSNSLRGVGRDTERIARRVAARLVCGDGPPQAGSTCVNIGVCRMCRSCRYSNPPVARVWCRAARR